MTKIVCNRKAGQARRQRLPARSCCIAAGGWRSHCGQATIEYAIVTGVLIALVVIMGLFLTTFGDYGERLLTIIASDYP